MIQTQLTLEERATLKFSITKEQLQELFSSKSLLERYSLDDSMFVIEQGRMFYYFGVIEPEVYKLLAVSAYNIFDTESSR